MYLTPTKANYLSNEFKKQSMVLKFSEETFLFTNTGEVKPLNDDNAFTKKPKINYEKYILELFEVDKELIYSNMVNKIVELTGTSISNAKYHINEMIKSELLIRTENKKYKLNIEQELYEWLFS